MTNQGTIDMEGTGYSATLYGTIVNQGTLNVVNNTAEICYGQNGGAGSFDNKGTINIAATATAPSNAPVLQVVGCTFTNDSGGNIINNGGFNLEPSGSPASLASYVQGNGTETGNNVVVHAGATLAYTGTGASDLEVNSSTSMTGNIVAGQSLQVDIGTVVTEPGSFTNAGTILLNGNYYGGGGGPAEIAIPSGTITNTGTLTAESNDNDPSISGNFVNNGTVVITPNTEIEQLAGNFTNGASGSFQPQISNSHYSDIRLDTGTAFIAGGTLAPQLEGGFVPAVGGEYPVISLRGGTESGTFASVAGNWHADYTNPGYLGAVYGPGASGGGGSSPSAGTSQASPSAKSLSGGAAEIKLALNCAGGATCLAYRLTGTVTEHLKQGRVTAVSARAGATAKKPTARTRVVTVASTSGSVAGGTSRALVIKLNRAGAALLKRFGRLRVRVSVTAGASTIESGTITVTAPKAKTKRK